MDTPITLDYVLVSLDAVREHHLIENALDDGREKVNADRVTTFTWITLGELDRAAAIVDANVAVVPESVPDVWRWYSNVCKAQQRAVWRNQLTDAEATAELERCHRIATLTGWR